MVTQSADRSCKVHKVRGLCHYNHVYCKHHCCRHMILPILLFLFLFLFCFCNLFDNIVGLDLD